MSEPGGPGPSSLIDSELRAVEELPGDYERAYMAREIFEELVDRASYLSRTADYKVLRHLPPTMQQYILPGIPDGTPEIDTLRPTDREVYMIQTEEHRITNLPQGIMMVSEPDKRLYLRAGLSECSVLAARSQDGRVFAAHASYSELREVEAVVAYLAEQGIAAEDIRVVAATNQPSTEIFVSDVTKPATLEDYARLGILPEHIRSFNYNLESGLEAADWTSYNLAQVLVTPDYVFTYNFDEIDTPSYGPQKRSAYRNEEILSLVD